MTLVENELARPKASIAPMPTRSFAERLFGIRCATPPISFGSQTVAVIADAETTTAADRRLRVQLQRWALTVRSRDRRHL